MLKLYDSLSKKQQEDFSEIYYYSFPNYERRPFEILIENSITGNYQLYALIINNHVEAIACVFTPKNNRLCLLDYFAVKENNRGKGIGSALFQELINRIKSLQRILILEVEDPTFGENNEEKIKRIHFYERNGAILIQNYNYLLPDLDGNGQTTPMKLMFAPNSENTIQWSENLPSFINLVFRDLYLCNEDNEILSLNIKNLPVFLII